MAFATPLVKFSAAITADQNVVVNTTYVQSVEKLDYPAGSAVDIQNGTNSTIYSILFTEVNPESETKNVLVRFTDEGDRDDAFDAFYTDGVTDLVAP